MDELKSCPWCGEVPTVSKYEPLYRPGVKFFYVKCRNRKCPMAHVQTYASRGRKKDAIEWWNTRWEENDERSE